MKQWREKNREHVKQYAADYHAANKEKFHQANAEWRENNKEYNAARMAAWSKANPEKRKATAAKTYQKYKERKKEQSRVYYSNNKLKMAATGKRWREKHKKQIRERTQKWYKENSHIAIAGAKRRYYRQRNATIGNTKPIAAWENQWKLKKKVVCYWCRKMFNPINCQSDHIVPISKGGVHSIENLCIACQPCNSQKHAKPVAQWVSEISQPTFLI